MLFNCPRGQVEEMESQKDFSNLMSPEKYISDQPFRCQLLPKRYRDTDLQLHFVVSTKEI